MKFIKNAIEGILRTSFYFLLLSLIYVVFVGSFYFFFDSEPGPGAIIWSFFYLLLSPIILIASLIFSFVQKALGSKIQKGGGVKRFLLLMQLLLGLIAFPVLIGVIYYAFLVL